jgi:CRISPR type I-E-associated protein CasB/Cse2
MSSTYRLVDHLASAAARNDGATLFALRRSWTQPLAIYSIVAPFLPLPPSKRAEDVSLLVARLFSEYPKLGDTPFAIGLARVAANRGGPSTELRMTALISATFVDLPRLLRRSVNLLRAEGATIDWHRLMDDLLRWDADGQPVQRAWARAFWGARGEAAAAEAAADGVVCCACGPSRAGMVRVSSSTPPPLCSKCGKPCGDAHWESAP